MGTCARLLPLLALAGCPAEQLGVQVPRGGVASVSQEDLQRDAWLLASLEDRGGRAPGTPGAEEAAVSVAKRLGQMHLEPGFGGDWRRPAAGDFNVCGRREGAGGSVLVVALDEGTGAETGAVPVAALISLAKAVDVPRGDGPTAVFCRVRGEAGLEQLLVTPPLPLETMDRILLLGPFGDGTLEATPVTVGSRDALRVTTGTRPFHGTPEDGLARLDYRRVEANVRAFHARWLASGS